MALEQREVGPILTCNEALIQLLEIKGYLVQL